MLNLTVMAHLVAQDAPNEKLKYQNVKFWYLAARDLFIIRRVATP